MGEGPAWGQGGEITAGLGVHLVPGGAWMGEKAAFVSPESSADNTKPMFGEANPGVFSATGLASAAVSIRQGLRAHQLK